MTRQVRRLASIGLVNRFPDAATLDTEFLARAGQLDAALSDDGLWERLVHVHVKDYAGNLRNGRGARQYAILGDGGIDVETFFAALRRGNYQGAPTLKVSPVTPDGSVDERRFRQAEAWLQSRPWLHPV